MSTVGYRASVRRRTRSRVRTARSHPLALALFLGVVVAALVLGAVLHHAWGTQPYSDVIVGLLVALSAGFYGQYLYEREDVSTYTD